MSKIRSGNTRPERYLRSELYKAGLRFRIHKAGLPGRPDIVFPGCKLAVLVHGCFWHRHDCPEGQVKPKTNSLFWERKFAINTARDAKVLSELRRLGWKVLTVWECNLEKTPGREINKVIKAVKKARKPQHA
jgi:DNA mismatch endonuclease (patch repair protein)